MEFTANLDSKGDLGTVKIPNKEEFKVGWPVEFGGTEECAREYNPEELFLASLLDCIFASFRIVARKMNLDYSSYSCVAEAIVEPVEGKLAFRKVIVKPKLVLPDASQWQKASRAIVLSKSYCLISNSMKCEIEMLPEITSAP